MKIERVQLIYFSAAGTTRTVGQAAEKGTGLPMEEWDCTPQRAKAPFQPDERTLTILAVPSFGGRVPAPVAKRLAAEGLWPGGAAECLRRARQRGYAG